MSSFRVYSRPEVQLSGRFPGGQTFYGLHSEAIAVRQPEDIEAQNTKKSLVGELFAAFLFGLFAPIILMTGGSFPRNQSKTATMTILVVSAVVYVGLLAGGLVLSLVFLDSEG